MTPPGTFDRVYAAIREQLREGRYRPGARLEPALLADELNASVTPVRDALHRLTGERLVEAPRHEGFRVPLLTETMLRHLYEWHLDLVLIALAHHGLAAAAEIPEMSGSDGRIQDRLNRLFERFARASGNPEHLLALQSLTERIEPAQRFESAVLDSIAAEADAIFEALNAGDGKRLRASLVRYHRRRLKMIPALLDQLNGHDRDPF